MEVAKVTSKGQITIPREENGKYFFQSSASEALKTIQNSMKGEAEKAGFNDPDDVVKYIKSRRKRELGTLKGKSVYCPSRLRSIGKFPKSHQKMKVLGI